jgi:hypothetical protein
VSSPLHEGGNHVTDVEVAAYLDRSLSARQRDRVEDHLAACPDCRRLLLETRDLLQRMRRPRKFLIGGTLAAAAAVVLLITRPDPASIDKRALMRGADTALPLPAYGPIGPATRVGLRFVWSAAQGAESYRLTVSRKDGEPVWASTGTDTVAKLPDSIALRTNERYFWVADVLLSDGTTRSTGLREFGVIR